MARPNPSSRSRSTRQPQPKSRRPKAGDPAANRATKMLLELLAIPGHSGQEGAVAEYISRHLHAAGANDKQLKTDGAHRKTRLKGEIGNLILKLPGTIRGPRRLLMAHMDTVPICVGCRPKVEGDFVHSTDPQTGLGGDDRAGVAVVLQTALDIIKKKLPHPPLTFLWTIQEEVGLHGARNLSSRSLGEPKLAFNFDGGAPEKLTIGATGGYRFAIHIRGRASHAGVAPEQGVSAIAIAALAISDLHENGWHGLIEKPQGTGTCNVGVIRGGEATNVVTDDVQIRAEARSHNNKFRLRIVREVEQAFRRAANKVKSANGKRGTVDVDGQLDYESYLIPRDQPCVLEAQRAVESLGLEPLLAVANGGLDANWMAVHGIPTVSLGCGQKNIHTVDEVLNLPQFHQARQIALQLATGTPSE